MICPTRKNEDAEILLDYCAQSLSPLQTAEFESHLNECGNCSRLVEAQKEVWESLEAWNPVPVSLNFDARLYARIAQEQAAPSWLDRLGLNWLRRAFQPPVPYSFWKSAVPLTAACAALALGLYVRTPDAPVAVSQHAPQSHQMHATDKVDIEQIEQTLEDLDILTPAPQAPAGSM